MARIRKYVALDVQQATTVASVREEHDAKEDCPAKPGHTLVPDPIPIREGHCTSTVSLTVRFWAGL